MSLEGILIAFLILGLIVCVGWAGFYFIGLGKLPSEPPIDRIVRIGWMIACLIMLIAAFVGLNGGNVHTISLRS
jgi:hypothetical protein